MEQFRPWRYRPVFPCAVYPVDRIARYTRSVTTFNMEDWTPALPLEGYDPLLWLRADQGLSTGGARQFYSSDKTSLQHTDNAFFSTGDIDFLWAGWVNFTSVSADQYIVSKDAADREWILTLDSSAQLNLYVNTSGALGGGTLNLLTRSGALSASRWYFVVVWHDATANTINIQVDNGAISSKAHASGSGDGTAAFILSSYSGANQFLNAKLSRVSFLKNSAARAVIDSAATRTEMYNLGRGILSGNLDLLLADLGTFVAGVDWDAWNLNETDGTAAARSFSGLNDLTPTFGELLADTGVETWTDATNLTSWSKSLSGTTTLNREASVVDAGTYSARFDHDVSGNRGFIFQSIGTALHQYNVSYRAKCSSGTMLSQIHTWAGAVTNETLTTAWQTFTNSITFGSAAVIYFVSSQNGSGASISSYYDTLSCKAFNIPACDGPSSDIAPDTGSVGTAHGQLIGYADSETARSTDTADGSPNPTVLNQVDETTYPGLMVGFAAPDTARSAHGLTGVPGKAISFDGTDDYIALSSKPISSGNFTIACWMKTDSLLGATQMGFAQGTAGGGAFLYLGYSGAGGSSSFVFWEGTKAIVSDANAAVSTWTHLAAVYDSAATPKCKLYVNGVLQSDNSNSTPSYTGDLYRLGLSTSGSSPLNGSLADPRIYSTALTAPQITAIATGDSGLTGSPVLRYDFDEDDTRTLTTIGAGTSLVFDGVDDRVQLSCSTSSLSITTGACSFSVWMKSSATTIERFVLDSSENGLHAGILLDFRSDQATKVISGYFFGTGVSDIVTNTFNVNDGLWHHIVLTRNGTTCSIYIDGVLSATATDNARNISHATTIAIGGQSGSDLHPFSGNLDDVRIYSTALSAAQVLQLYEGTEATGATPVSMWTFDEETSVSLTDGDPIATWTSLEGSRHQFIQATASKRGVWVESAINIQSGIQLDGVDDIYGIVSAVLTGTAGTAIAICKVKEVPNAYQTLLASSDTATATKYLALHIRGNTANGHLGYGQNNAGTEDLLDGDTAVTDELNCAAYWASNGTTVTARLNGTAQTLNADTGANNGDWWDDTTGKDNVTIGALKHTSEVNQASVILCELIVYPINLSAASRASVASYIMSRYGLTL